MSNLSRFPHLKAIVFDLDDTLFDTYGQLVKIAARESVLAMMEAGFPGTLEEGLALRDKLFRENPRVNVYQAMARAVGLKESIASKVTEAGFKAFHHRKVEKNIHPFPETRPTLTALKKSYKIFCVTVGDPSTQIQKIENLDLGNLFDEIWYVDISKGHSKKQAYIEMLKKHALKPEEVLSVGNRIDSEIRDSKELDMHTCLVLHGEYLHLKPQDRFEKPDFEIKSVGELLK